MGGSVSGAGDVNGDGYADVIVGAERYTTRARLTRVRRSCFTGRPSGVANGNPATAMAQLESNQANAWLGVGSVSSAGDVNGDGYADVIVGTYRYDAGEADEGAAFVFLGSAVGDRGRGQSRQRCFTARVGPGTSRNLGFSVAGAGDVNGDGYADVIVGAPVYDAGESAEGAALVFLGGASGIVAAGDPSNAAAQLASEPGERAAGPERRGGRGRQRRRLRGRDRRGSRLQRRRVFRRRGLRVPG